MRIEHTLTLIAAATLSLPALAVNPSTVGEATAGALANVHVVASSSYKPRPFELEGVQGTYALDDGRTLRVASEHRKLFAKVGQDRFEIVPVAPNVFAARDRALELRFDQIPFATNVTLSQAGR